MEIAIFLALVMIAWNLSDIGESLKEISKKMKYENESDMPISIEERERITKEYLDERMNSGVRQEVKKGI